MRTVRVVAYTKTMRNPDFHRTSIVRGDENDASLFSSSQQCTGKLLKKLFESILGYVVVPHIHSVFKYHDILEQTHKYAVGHIAIRNSFLLQSPSQISNRVSLQRLSLQSPPENVPPEQFTSVNTHELPISSQNLRTASMVLSVNRLLFLKFNTLKRFNDEVDPKDFHERVVHVAAGRVQSLHANISCPPQTLHEHVASLSDS